ncbi:hypothetical protein FJC69_22675 [Escherichia coli]|nr:hypothetical protein [Escherichia coli]
MLPVLPAFLIYRMSGSVNRIQIPGVPPVLTGSREQAYRRLKPVYTFLERQFERKALVQL